MFTLVPVYLLIYYTCNLYNPKRSRSRRLELLDLCRANIFGIAFLSTYITFMQVQNMSRWFILYFFITNLTLGFAFRRGLIMILRHFRKKGYNIKHIVIVGYSRAAEGYIDRILKNPEWGYQIHGILDDNKKPGESYRDIKVLGKIDNLFKILPKNKLDEIKENPKDVLQGTFDDVKEKINDFIDDNFVEDDNIHISEDEIVISKTFSNEGDNK